MEDKTTTILQERQNLSKQKVPNMFRVMLSDEVSQMIKDISLSTGIKEPEFVRELITSTLLDMRYDCGGDYNKLEVGRFNAVGVPQ